jgi:hypothetical protein
MSDYLANICITAGILWITFIGYRLYFNVPDIEDLPRDAPLYPPVDDSEVPEPVVDAPADVVMEEIYNRESQDFYDDAPEAPDTGMDELVAQLNVVPPPSPASDGI